MSLFETDWANVQTKLLISSTNVHRCNIEDGQTGWFVCSVLNHCLAPLTSVSLQMQRKEVSATCKKETMCDNHFDSRVEFRQVCRQELKT